jgi:hypothetical protein
LRRTSHQSHAASECSVDSETIALCCAQLEGLCETFRLARGKFGIQSGKQQYIKQNNGITPASHLAATKLHKVKGQTGTNAGIPSVFPARG